MADDQQPIEEKKDGCESCGALERERDEYKASWMRAHADYQNLQKEMQQWKSEWVQLSEVRVIEEFLPVYDNFKKAFAHKPEDGAEHKHWQNWAAGIGFIQKQFSDILKNHTIEEVPTVGHVFEPTMHESVGEEEKDDAAEHTIIREVESGYMLKGKIIKVAKVIVARKKEVHS